MKSPLEALQPLGRALMLPIAVLPVAGLLLRLGQPDLLNVPFMAAAGDAIFSNLGLLFAIGVAVGFARESHGAAGLAGVVCFLVATKGAEVLIHVPPTALTDFTGPSVDLAAAAYKAKALAKLSVPIGIASGLIGGVFYNRFSTFKLPEYLAFFSGRRFVPIISGLAGLAIAAGVGLGYGALDVSVDVLSRGVVAAGGLGLFAFGILNRLLIVTGLHHILNNIAWFVVGDFHGTTGDLRRFFAGDPSAGAFMAGFFPVMMFGLPAACLAMYHAAPKINRKAVAGMLLSLALTSFLTGVTEPIEFTFMFLAPVLFLIHAVLTGLSMVVMNLLDVKMGFGFSAGLFDYLLNYGRATRPLLLLPVGVCYALIYYVLFRVAIRVFDLKTPGRGSMDETVEASTPQVSALRDSASRGQAFLAALGGGSNLTSIDACITRLRLVVVDQSRIDEVRLKGLGARGLIRPSAAALQVVLGPIADEVAGEIRDALKGSHGSERPAPAPTLPIPDGEASARPSPSDGLGQWTSPAFIDALGGSKNVVRIQAVAGRLRLELVDVDLLDDAVLKALGVRAIARLEHCRVHLIVPPASLTS